MNKRKNSRHNIKNYSSKVLSDKTPFAINECFKQLRSNLFFTSKNEECPVFAITSAYAHSGKSMIIANTALSHAMLGKKVLLIDGDMRCPVQHFVFSKENDIGLSALLASSEDGGEILDSYVEKTEYEGLDVITSGRIPPNPSELLSSVRMKELLDVAKAKYDYIFIDLPPICEVADGGVIAGLVTGYIFVIRSETTDSRSVQDALNLLENVGANVVGFVLNDVNPKTNGKNRKYGKYSRYGYYNNYQEAQGE